RRLVGHLVQLGRDGVLFLFLLVGRGAGGDLVFALVLGFRLGRGRTGADAAIADRLVGAEFGRALRAMRRTLVEVVELRLAGGADLLGAELRVGQRVGPSKNGWVERRAPLPRRGAAVKSQIPGPICKPFGGSFSCNDGGGNDRPALRRAEGRRARPGGQV